MTSRNVPEFEESTLSEVYETDLQPPDYVEYVVEGLPPSEPAEIQPRDVEAVRAASAHPLAVDIEG